MASNDVKIQESDNTEKLCPSESNSKNVRGNILVLDSAISWVVCGANFVILCLSAVFGRMLSMCFLQLVQEFDVSIATTSLSLTFYLLTLSFSSILATSALFPMTGVRVATLIACIVSGVCTMCLGMASNIALFIFFMAIKGTCVGISLVAAISLVTQYFEKRRSLATAFANCGLSAGSMGAPPLINLLMEHYGLRGTFLIIGAIELNAVAAAILLRPIGYYSAVITSTDPFKSSETANETKDTVAEIMPSPIQIRPKVEKDDLLSPDQRQTQKCNAMKTPHVIVSDIDITSDDMSSLFDSSHCLSSSRDIGHSPPTINNISDDRLTMDRGIHVVLPREMAVSETEPRKQSNSTIENVTNHGQLTDVPQSLQNDKLRPYCIAPLEQNPSQQLIPIITLKYDNSDSGLDMDTEHISIRPDRGYGIRNERIQTLSVSSSHNSNECPLRSPKAKQRHNMYGECRLSSWSIVSSVHSDFNVDVEVCAMEYKKRQLEGEVNDTMNMKTLEKNVRVTADTLPSRVLSVFRNVFNLSLLRMWTMRLLLLSAATGTLTNYLPTYLPTIALKRGMTVDQVSILLTISGTVGLVGRIFLGFFSDLYILTPSQIVVISQISLGTVCHFIAFFTTFDLFIFLAIVIGLFSTTRQNLVTLIIIDFLGHTNFLKGLGSVAMVGTLSLALHHPLLNSMLDSTGGYAPPFHYVGLALYFSAVCLLLGPWLKQRELKRSQRRPLE